MLDIVKSLNSNVLWGWPVIIILLGTGVLYSIMTGFIQFRRMGVAFKQTFGSLFEKKEREPGEISSFQSLATAIAAQVGTGNLAGVAGAIASGGPGAIFWMWISGLFGMGTIFAEAVVSQRFVQVRDGKKVGGPAYYIRYGLKDTGFAKFLAGFFAVAIILALGIMGNGVQANSIASAANTAFGIPPLVMGIVIAVIVMLIVAGGISRIASVTEKVVPFMALFYIIGSLIIIGRNYDQIVPAFEAIFSSAFSSQAMVGGAVGVSIKHAFRYGIARGLFSNEAGMGSTPHAHAIADVKHPGEQGMVATMGVLIDTLIICTVTALVILTTGALSSGTTGAELTQHAFTLGFGSLGTKFVSICLLFFALTTIIGWYFFGETNVKYLFGKTGIWPFRFLVVAMIIFSTTMKVELVWELADSLNALMVLPNLIALLAMMGLVHKIRKDFEQNYLKGKPSAYLNDEHMVK